MKKSFAPLIYPAFVIASAFVVNILLPPVVETSHVLFDEINVTNSKIIVAREGLITIAFDDTARMPTVTWVTWIATVTKVTTPTPTSTPVRVLPMPPSLLLDRLADKKPSIWGSKGFYILLGLVYITLLGLFLKQVISTRSHKQH
jgi:hypothetical protein